MPDDYTPEEIIAKLPSALTRLDEVDEYDILRMRAVVADEGLVHSSSKFGKSPNELRLLHSGHELKSFQRKLNGAINQVLGKPAGTAKQYSTGPFRCMVNVHDDHVSVYFLPQHSLRILVRAAKSWLDGTPLDVWSEAAGSTLLNPTEPRIARPFARRREDDLSYSLTLDAGMHPAGAVTRTRPERENALRDHFVVALGEPVVPKEITRATTWIRGGREIALVKGLSSGSHNLDFKHREHAE